MTDLHVAGPGDEPPTRDARPDIPHPPWCAPSNCLVRFGDDGICGPHTGPADVISTVGTEVTVRLVQHVWQEKPKPVGVELATDSGFLPLTADEAEILGLMLRRLAKAARPM